MIETRTRSRNSESAHELAHRCAELMLDKKAKQIVILDLNGLTDIADYFVVCSADSDTHLKAIADGVLDNLADEGVKPYRTEGWQAAQWIILDFVEVVCHVFYKETREFYKIERLWADAKVEEITEEN
jgi:ribosome-associated protein